MRLWKVTIKTYIFGIQRYVLFVLAYSENAMINIVKQYPIVRKDEDAEIENYEEINLDDVTDRVL